MVQLAKDQIIGRTREIKGVQVFLGEPKTTLMLVGEAGEVGKNCY